MANGDCSSKVCEFWNKGSGPHDCVDTATVCYADMAAAAGGSGSLAAPYTSPSSCAASSKIIALADGAYPSLIPTVTSELAITGTGAGATLYNNGVLQVAADITLKVSANSGTTLRLVGLSVGGGVAADQATLLQLIRTRTLSNVTVTQAGNVKLQDVSVEGGQLDHGSGTITLQDVRVSGTTGIGFRSKNSVVQGSGLTVTSASEDCIHLSQATVDLDRVSIEIYGLLGIEVVNGSSGKMSNVLVVGTTNTNFVVQTASPFTLSHATLLAASGDPMSCTAPATKVVNSILADEQGANEKAASQCTVTYSFTSESGTGNMTGGAELVSPLTGDYRLKPSSGRVDSGIDLVPGGPNPTTDLDGNPRRVTKKTNTNSADMGAYELQ